jgi:hypothetical protein
VIIATAASTIVGFFARFSLVGSLLPIIVTLVSIVLLLVVSIMATVIYTSIVGIFDIVLRTCGVDATMGLNMFALGELSCLPLYQVFSGY